MALDAMPQSSPIDPKSGQLRPEWRRWLKQVDTVLRAYLASLEE